MSGRGPGGRTELHYAALATDVPTAAARLVDQERAAEVACVLLDHGAEVDRANIHGNTAVFTAVFSSRGDGSVIRLLRGRGADRLRENRRANRLGPARFIGNYDVAQFFADLP